jgi:hypothetical protein
MRKIDPIYIYTQKQAYTNSYVEHASNSGTTPWDSGKDGKEKRMMEHSNIVKHNICEGRGFKDVY